MLIKVFEISEDDWAKLGRYDDWSEVIETLQGIFPGNFNGSQCEVTPESYHDVDSGELLWSASGLGLYDDYHFVYLGHESRHVGSKNNNPNALKNPRKFLA